MPKDKIRCYVKRKNRRLLYFSHLRYKYNKLYPVFIVSGKLGDGGQNSYIIDELNEKVVFHMSSPFFKDNFVIVDKHKEHRKIINNLKLIKRLLDKFD